MPGRRPREIPTARAADQRAQKSSVALVSPSTVGRRRAKPQVIGLCVRLLQTRSEGFGSLAQEMSAVDHRPVGCAAAPPRRFGETAPCRQASRTDRALSTAAERPYHFSRRTEWSVDSPSLHVLVASICKWFANARTSRGDKRRRLASSGAVRNPWKICLDRQASCRVKSEQAPSKQWVGGSNPSGRARPSKIWASEGSHAAETPGLGNGSPLIPDGLQIAGLAEAFLLHKRLGGCTEATIRTYRFWLNRLEVEVTDVSALDAVAVTRFLVRLR